MHIESNTVKSSELLLGDGHRKKEFKVGNSSIYVFDIRGECMTAEEWQVFHLARDAYSKWGGSSTDLSEVKFDTFDGLESGSPYLTFHYAAYITTDLSRSAHIRNATQAPLPNPEDKLVTMRLVQVMERDVEKPDDLTFWTVFDPITENYRRLDNYLELYHKQYQESRYEVYPYCPATISRLGTFPIKNGRDDEYKKARTALGFAAIQQMVVEDMRCQYLVTQLRPELPTYLGINNDNSDTLITPKFSRADKVLNVPIKLDNNNEHVQFLKFNYPGYWFNREMLYQTLLDMCSTNKLDPLVFLQPFLNYWKDVSPEALLAKGVITQSDIGLFDRFMNGDTSALIEESILKRMLTLITTPSNARYLAQLISNENREFGQSLQEELLRKGGDGPFSSLIHIDDWKGSTNDVLLAGQKFT